MADIRCCLAQFRHWPREYGAPLAACSRHDVDIWPAEDTVTRFKV
ncbi:hypothetical protein [Streptomyces sp. STR69]|nr:hypothetical protein [Streptomyces sp. STR69]